MAASQLTLVDAAGRIFKGLYVGCHSGFVPPGPLEEGWGFISCLELQLVGDVFVQGSLITGVQIGDRVVFELSFSGGMPVARHVKKEEDTPPPSAAKDEKGEEDEKGET